MGVLTFGECDDAYEELRRVRPAVLRSGRAGWGADACDSAGDQGGDGRLTREGRLCRLKARRQRLGVSCSGQYVYAVREWGPRCAALSVPSRLPRFPWSSDWAVHYARISPTVQSGPQPLTNVRPFARGH